jgi:hypothetical protein
MDNDLLEEMLMSPSMGNNSEQKLDLDEPDCPFKGEEQMVFSVESSSE